MKSNPQKQGSGAGGGHEDIAVTSLGYERGTGPFL